MYACRNSICVSHTEERRMERKKEGEGVGTGRMGDGCEDRWREAWREPGKQLVNLRGTAPPSARFPSRSKATGRMGLTSRSALQTAAVAATAEISDSSRCAGVDTRSEQRRGSSLRRNGGWCHGACPVLRASRCLPSGAMRAFSCRRVRRAMVPSRASTQRSRDSLQRASWIASSDHPRFCGRFAM